MMNEEERRAIYQACSDKWGETAQAQQVVEECGELIQAVSKIFFRGNFDDKSLDNLASEVADVSIMLEQLVCILGPVFLQKVEEQTEFKLGRLKTRVENPKREHI